VEIRPTLELVNQWFGAAVPHNKWLGLTVEEILDDGAISRLPHDDKLIGNPQTGFLHGGVITSMVDASCGMAVFIAMRSPRRIATLDLRIDYLRPTTPATDVLCKAQCYKLTRNVAFVKALAYHDDDADPIASAAGTFVIFTGDNRSTASAALKNISS
jgi:uncharacterized protein (TIGR00369 family)